MLSTLCRYRSKFPMANSTFEHEKDADPMPHASNAFYTSLFQDQLDRGVAMTNYEVDFLADQTQWFVPFVETVDGSKDWLNGMASAARSFFFFFFFFLFLFLFSFSCSSLFLSSPSPF